MKKNWVAILISAFLTCAALVAGGFAFSSTLANVGGKDGIVGEDDETDLSDEDRENLNLPGKVVVTLVNPDDSPLVTLRVTEGTVYHKIENSLKAYLDKSQRFYAFWVGDTKVETFYTFSSNVTLEIDYIDTLTINTYINGEIFQTITKDEYSKLYLDELSKPSIIGKTLEGWYLEPTFETRNVFYQPLKGSFNLYGKLVNPIFQIPVYNHRNVIDGSPINYEFVNLLTTLEFESGTLLDFPDITPIPMEGYEFTGFKLMYSGIGDNDESYDQAFGLPVYADNIIYGTWIPSSSTVQYFSELTGELLKTETFTTNNYNFHFPTPPSVPGYLFTGWYRLNPNGTKTYTFATTSTLGFNPDFYAEYEPIVATVNLFMGNGNLVQTLNFEGGYTIEDFPVLENLNGWYYDDSFYNRLGNSRRYDSANYYAKIANSAADVNYQTLTISFTRAEIKIKVINLDTNATLVEQWGGPITLNVAQGVRLYVEIMAKSTWPSTWFSEPTITGYEPLTYGSGSDIGDADKLTNYYVYITVPVNDVLVDGY